jgi:FHA domain
MSEMLVNNPDSADALLDMSNIVRYTRLGGEGPADLVRLERVGEALATLYGAATVAMFSVADRSLLAQPELFRDPAQRRTLRRWAGSGLIHEVPKADVQLLQIAEETGLPIITRDRFVGHRREFPWLNDRDDAVLEPQADPFGYVYLRHVTLNRKDDWELSQREEKDLFLQQGLSGQPEVLGRYWSCPERRCARHDPASGRFVLLPRASDGRLICDVHGEVMNDRGPRPRVAQLKVMRDGREELRFTVAEGEPVSVGRSPEGVDLTPFLSEADTVHVSRKHLLFGFDSTGLTVTDRSKNGTTLFLQHGTQRDFSHLDTRPFTKGDRAQIVPGVEIIRSGREYPSELPGRRAPRRPDGPPPSPTVVF